jgi:hypothetical protein
MPPYVYERQTEYWTSRGIEDYFLDAGYEVVAFPLTQHAEKQVPVDFIFFDGSKCKLFGLQYKALYQNAPDYWPIDQVQHSNLQTFAQWAWYCLSEVKSGHEHRIALHKARFVRVHTVQPGHLSFSKQGYWRWGGFEAALETCTAGVRVKSEEELRSALRPSGRKDVPEIDQMMVDVFVAELTRRRLLHLYPPAVPPRGDILDHRRR